MPSARKIDTPVNSILGDLIKQLDDCLQLGCSCWSAEQINVQKERAANRLEVN